MDPGAPPPGPAVVPFADALNVTPVPMYTSLAAMSDSGRDPRTVIVLLSPITRSPATVNVARPFTTEAVTGVPKNVSGLSSSPEITRFVVSIVTVRAAEGAGATAGLNAVKIWKA